MKASMRVAVHFTSSDYERTETGYSNVGDASNYRTLYIHAIWNAAYQFFYHTGQYFEGYKVLNSKLISFGKERIIKGKKRRFKEFKNNPMTRKEKKSAVRDVKKNISKGRMEGTKTTRKEIDSLYKQPKANISLIRQNRRLYNENKKLKERIRYLESKTR
jgi:hypothetical protein